MPSGVVYTYNIPYLLDIPKIIWRLESAFLSMDGNTSNGTFLMRNCKRDDSDHRLIVCIHYVTIGTDGDTVECRLHIKLVFPTPIGVMFKVSDTYSAMPYLDVADLGGIVEFTAQTELFVYDNGLIPAGLYFNNLQPSLPRELYRSYVKMAFYYEPTSFKIPCPSLYPSFLDCVAANGQYFALDRVAKTWSEHMEAGNAYGLSLITAGEDENSEANVRVKMALSALSTTETIDNGVWFAGKYNTADSRWEYSDGSTMAFVANPKANDYCALYDDEGPFGWANDSCNESYMAIFEVPQYSFQISSASSSCQIPTISFDQTGDTIRLSLLDHMGRSTTESDVSFSIAQTISDLTPEDAVGHFILGIQANGTDTQSSLNISTNDADADPTNEIQDIVVNQTVPGLATLTLSDPSNPPSGFRPSVDIVIDDADANPNNEFQTLVVDANPVGNATLTLSDPSGLGPTSTVFINTNDSDADPTNEIQYLVRNYDTVSITGTDGNSIDLGHLNKFSLPFYLAVGENKQKNVFGHPFGATSFAAPYALEYSAYSALVTDTLPPGCNLEIHVEFSDVSGDSTKSEVLLIKEKTRKNAGPYIGTDPIEIPQLGEITITSVNTVGKCNGMNSESATVLLIFRVLG